MLEIIIKDIDQEYLAVVTELPTKLKIKGTCTVLKKNRKYSIQDITMTPPMYRIEAIGYNHCTHMIGGMCYNNQQRLGPSNCPSLINCLNKQIEL